MTPEQRVGKIANLVIFLGILYSIVHLAGLLGSASAAARGDGWCGLGVTLGIIGLCYGIRFGSLTCLYLATGFFICLMSYAFYRLAVSPSFVQSLRLLLSLWVGYGLCRAIPAMHILKQTHSTPVQTSRYGEFFLHRWMKS